MKFYDAVVIGGGVLGCFTARNLRRWNISVLLIEAAEDVCTGITRSNTAIVYSGCDNKPNSLKAHMTVRANAEFEALCQELEVPFKRCGSLMVSCGPKGNAVLQKKLEKGRLNGVPGLRILSAAEALELEPALTKGIHSALYAPSTGTVNPWQFGIAAFENAIYNDCVVSLHNRVLAIQKYAGGYVIETEQGSVRCRVLCNCAGLQAAQVQEMLFPPSVRIVPDAGDYLVLDKSVVGPKHIIFHESEESGKGLTAVPTVEGSLLLGPTKRPCTEEYAAVERNELESLQKLTQEILPDVDLKLQIRSFAAVRPNPQHVIEKNGQYLPDGRSINSFVIEEPAPGFYSLIGIKTPGLTCADPLGAYLARKAADYLHADKNMRFVSKRMAIKQARQLEYEARAALVAQAPDYGELICHCEDVTRAEVLVAIDRGAVDINGVKRRVGAGLGRCQGGRCRLAVEALLKEAGHEGL